MADIREKIKDALDEAGVRYRPNSRSFVVNNCIDCGKDLRQYIEQASGWSICFSCEKRYAPVALIARVSGISYAEAKARLGGSFLDGVKAPDINDSVYGLATQLDRINVKKPKLTRLSLPFNFRRPVEGDAGDLYYQKRGVDRRLYSIYDLRWSPEMSRVIIPVYMDGVCVGWQGRDITGTSERRLLFPPSFVKSACLLGYDQLKQTGAKDAIVTEGPFDAFACAGLGAELCTFGKHVSPYQVSLLLSAPSIKRIYLALDPDASDQITELSEIFKSCNKEVWLLQPPLGRKDLGECSHKEALEAKNNATRYDNRLSRIIFNLQG